MFLRLLANETIKELFTTYFVAAVATEVATRLVDYAHGKIEPREDESLSPQKSVPPPKKKKKASKPPRSSLGRVESLRRLRVR